MITLREVTDENYRDCYELQHADQQFVESPVHILAEAYISRHDWTAYCIYWHDELIGMTLLRNKPADGTKSYGFSEFLIADNHRRKGLGTAAVKAILHKLRTEHGFTEVKICVYEDNTTARNFYKKIGFQEGKPAEWCDAFIEYSEITY